MIRTESEEVFSRMASKASGGLDLVRISVNTGSWAMERKEVNGEVWLPAEDVERRRHAQWRAIKDSSK